MAMMIDLRCAWCGKMDHPARECDLTPEEKRLATQRYWGGVSNDIDAKKKSPPFPWGDDLETQNALSKEVQRLKASLTTSEAERKRLEKEVLDLKKQLQDELEIATRAVVQDWNRIGELQNANKKLEEDLERANRRLGRNRTRNLGIPGEKEL